MAVRTTGVSYPAIAAYLANAGLAGPSGATGATGAPGGVDAPTAAVINEGQAALASKEDVATVQVFTANGTWTMPANAKRVRVRVQAAGGGGGGGSSTASGVANSGGGGGGGGAVFESEFLASELTSTVAVTVGTGGTGGAGAASGAGAGSNGTNGGNSSFGSYLLAGGGGFGQGGQSAALSTGGGAGGMTSASGSTGGTAGGCGGSGSTGTVGAVGGSGGSGSSAAGASTGGTAAAIGGGAGGGSGAGVTAANAAAAGGGGGRAMGGPASGGAAGATNGGAGGTLADALWKFPGAGGGGGGSSTTQAGGAGGAGQNYGGGGGGGGGARTGFAGGNGGAGGNGVVVVTTWTATPTALSPVVTGGGVANPAQSSTAIGAPNYGSAKFPDFNGQFAGSYGLIGQPTTNFGTWFGADGCLFMEVEIPQERMAAARQHLIFGNALGTSAGTIGLCYFDQAYFTTGVRRQFQIAMRDAGVNTVNASSPAIPTTVQRAIIYVSRISGNVTVSVLDIDTGTLYAGTPVSAGAFAGIASFSGSTVQIGDCRGSTTAERGSFSNTVGAWPGSIGKIGYTTNTVADANFEALRTGTDPLVQFGASLKWYRALDGGASSLLRLSSASGDTTSGATIYGRVGQAGHLAQSCNVQLGRVADGQVFAALPGERFARVQLPFTCKNIGSGGDTLEVRIVDSAGSPVLDWTGGALLASGQTSGTAEVTCPISARWLKAEARLMSARTATNMAPGLFGVGAGCGLLGQSQIANGLGRAGLALGYDGQTAASLALTTSNGTVIWRLDQGKIVSDMMAAACQQAARVYPGAQGWIIDAVGGTSPDDLIDDAQSGRLWTQWAGVVAQAKAQLSTILFPWFTSLVSLTGNPYNMTITEQLDAVLRGRGRVAKDHFLYESGFLPAGGTVVVYPGSRHDAAGTLTADGGGGYGTARDAMRAWVAAQNAAGNANFLIGPEQINTLVDQYHPADDAPGDLRLGYSLGVGLGIGMRTFTLAEAYVDGASFAFTDGTRTAFTFDVVTPGNTPICNFLGATYAAGADKGVMGVEVSTDGGSTWSYMAATACQITGRFRVTVTKPSGAWAAGLKAKVMSGGPMAYGTSNADSSTAAQKYGLGDGDARMLTGFGNPIKCANTVYSVAG